MIWGSRWYIIALPALMYLASSGADVIRSLFMNQTAHCQPVDSFFFFGSARDPVGVGLGPTSRLYPEHHASRRRTMGLSERELEHRRHLDDLLPPPTDASALAASARFRDVQDIHQYRRDDHRVLRALYPRRHRCTRRHGP
jgi:hypothetical protein